MTNYVYWPLPQKISTANKKMNLISVPVTLLLSKIAKHTVALQKEKLYLSSSIGYRALSTWFTKYSKTSTENENNSSAFSNVTVNNKETKISASKVPILGEMLLTVTNRLE